MTKKTARQPALVTAQAKYADKVLLVKVTANPETEVDIHQWLFNQSNRSGAIKKLIRADIAKNKQSS
jgi:hypothetical protein